MITLEDLTTYNSIRNKIITIVLNNYTITS